MPLTLLFLVNLYILTFSSAFMCVCVLGCIISEVKVQRRWSQAHSSSRTRDNRHKLKHRRFPLKIRKRFFTVIQVALRGCGVSFL